MVLAPMPPRTPSGSGSLSKAEFERLYRDNAAAVMALCAHRGLRAQDAADVCSEAFLTALAEREQFDPELGTAAAWLFGIARNVLRRHHDRSLRATSLQERLFGDRLVLTVDDVAEYAELRADAERLLSSIAGLSERDRALLLDHRLESTSYEALTERHEASVETLRKRLSRTLASLRKTYEEGDR